MSEDKHLYLASMNITQKKLDKTLKEAIVNIKGLIKENLLEVRFNYNQKHKYERPEGDVIVEGFDTIENKLLDLRWKLQNLLNSSRFNGKPVVDVVEALKAETTNKPKTITACDIEEASVLKEASNEAVVISLKEVSQNGWQKTGDDVR